MELGTHKITVADDTAKAFFFMQRSLKRHAGAVHFAEREDLASQGMIGKLIIGFLALALLVGGTAARAADPDFKLAIVTAARTYERQSTSFNVGGFRAAGKTTSVSRVTVALDGTLYTGEWEPKTLRSVTAKDFRRGAEVPAAVERNRLSLKLPDGSVLTAKIVDREKQRGPSSLR